MNNQYYSIFDLQAPEKAIAEIEADERAFELELDEMDRELEGMDISTDAPTNPIPPREEDGEEEAYRGSLGILKSLEDRKRRIKEIGPEIEKASARLAEQKQKFVEFGQANGTKSKTLFEKLPDPMLDHLYDLVVYALDPRQSANLDRLSDTRRNQFRDNIVRIVDEDPVLTERFRELFQGARSGVPGTSSSDGNTPLDGNGTSSSDGITPLDGNGTSPSDGITPSDGNSSGLEQARKEAKEARELAEEGLREIRGLKAQLGRQDIPRARRKPNTTTVTVQQTTPTSSKAGAGAGAGAQMQGVTGEEPQPDEKTIKTWLKAQRPVDTRTEFESLWPSKPTGWTDQEEQELMAKWEGDDSDYRLVWEYKATKERSYYGEITLWKTVTKLFRCLPTDIIPPSIMEFRSSRTTHVEIKGRSIANPFWTNTFCGALIDILVHPQWYQNHRLITVAVQLAVICRTGDTRTWKEVHTGSGLDGFLGMLLEKGRRNTTKTFEEIVTECQEHVEDPATNWWYKFCRALLDIAREAQEAQEAQESSKKRSRKGKMAAKQDSYLALEQYQVTELDLASGS